MSYTHAPSSPPYTQSPGTWNVPGAQPPVATTPGVQPPMAPVYVSPVVNPSVSPTGMYTVPVNAVQVTHVDQYGNVISPEDVDPHKNLNKKLCFYGLVIVVCLIIIVLCENSKSKRYH